MHSDVRPENILITHDEFAYLMDLGIANAAADQKLAATPASTADGSGGSAAPVGDEASPPAPSQFMDFSRHGRRGHRRSSGRPQCMGGRDTRPGGYGSGVCQPIDPVSDALATVDCDKNTMPGGPYSPPFFVSRPDDARPALRSRDKGRRPADGLPGKQHDVADHLARHGDARKGRGCGPIPTSTAIRNAAPTGEAPRAVQKGGCCVNGRRGGYKLAQRRKEADGYRWRHGR